MQRLPDSVQKLWRAGGVLTGGFMGLMFGSIIGGTLVAFGPPNWLYSVAALPVIIGAGIGYWWAESSSAIGGGRSGTVGSKPNMGSWATTE